MVIEATGRQNDTHRSTFRGDGLSKSSSSFITRASARALLSKLAVTDQETDTANDGVIYDN